VPDAGPREHIRGYGTERATAQYQRRGIEQPALPGFTEARQQHLPVVTSEIAVHCYSG
jgi:hypothetical protein